jgi:hypothetical protein
MYSHLLQCSTTCGTGVQQRKVVCRVGHGKIVPNELCIGSKKPRSQKKCGAGDCSEFMWRTGDWSEVYFCNHLLVVFLYSVTFPNIVICLTLQC